MRHIKHWLATMAVLLCSVEASSQTFEVEGLKYTVLSSSDMTISVEKGSTNPTGDLIIPATITYEGDVYDVTEIGSYAFKNCTSLTSITIPESVTSIGQYAFYDCTGELTVNCNVPSGVYDDAPFYFSKFTKVIIGDGVTKIGSYAFYCCNSLTSITIPESVTSIGYEAFSGCNSLTAVHISSIEAWCNIPYGGGDSNPLCYAQNLYLNGVLVTELVIPEGVTSIGERTFYGCSSLTSITIPDDVSEINSLAFRGCNNIKEVTFGKGLKKIGSNAFADSKDIEKIIIYAIHPPRIDGIWNSIFSDATYENATLYVPQGSVSKYQVITGWSGFYNISEIEGDTPEYLSIRQADNGAVGIAVDFGRTYKVCITPSEGWAVHSVTFNGEDITAQLGEDNTLTTPTINGSAELNVAYEQLGGNEVKSTRANAIKVSGYEGVITVDGCADGENITIYTADGAMIAQQETEGESTRISVTTGQLYIIKVVDMVVKILM